MTHGSHLLPQHKWFSRCPKPSEAGFMREIIFGTLRTPLIQLLYAPTSSENKISYHNYENDSQLYIAIPGD